MFSEGSRDQEGGLQGMVYSFHKLKDPPPDGGGWLLPRILGILSCRPRFQPSRCILLVDMDTTYAVRK